MPESSVLSPEPPAAAPVATPAATPEPTTTPVTPPSWTDSDGNFSDKWLDRLPADKVPPESKVSLAKFRSVADLAKSYYHNEQMLGKKASAVLIPKPDSSAEEVAAYRKAVGVPEKVEEYQFKPDTLPKDYPWDDNGPLQSTVRTIAHKHNIPPTALKELATAYTQYEALQLDEAGRMSQEQLDQGFAELKSEWKGNYQKNINLAERGTKTVGGNVESFGFKDPEVIKVVQRLTDMLSEDKLVTGEFNPTDKPGEARALAIIKGSDPSVMHLHKLYREGDEATVKMVRQMMQT